MFYCFTSHLPGCFHQLTVSFFLGKRLISYIYHDSLFAIITVKLILKKLVSRKRIIYTVCKRICFFIDLFMRIKQFIINSKMDKLA